MGAGVAFLPSCVYKQDKLSIQLNRIQIKPDQERFLFALANCIIPKTDTPGAADLGAHLFALKMVDDCFEQPLQQKFISGLTAFQKLAVKQLGKPFEEVTAPEQLKFLQATVKDAADPGISSFLNDFKRLVTRGYTQSEYVMTKLLPYKLVPGKFKACIPFNDLQKA